MELKDVVSQVLKKQLKEMNFKTKGFDWWKEIDGGYLMIHLKKSVFSNKANGFNSELIMFSVSKEELTGKISDIWLGYQPDHVNLTSLVPEYGFFTEGLNGGYFDFSIVEKNPKSGKIYTPEQWESIVTSLIETYLVPFIDSADSVKSFETIKEELNKKKFSSDARIYSFYSLIPQSGMYETNKANMVEMIKRDNIPIEALREKMPLLDRFLDGYRASFRNQYEETLRKFTNEVIEEAEKER